MMKKEFRTFLAALSFYTRIPVCRPSSGSDSALGDSAKYLPLIGWLTGGVSGLTYFLCGYIFRPALCLLFSMLAGIWLTGAFHEDGLADFCDGFGAGFSKEKILQIMKDSRIGTYGVIGLIIVLSFKFLAAGQLLQEATDPFIGMLTVFILPASVSRLFSVSFMYTHIYVSDREHSKSKNAVQKGNMGQFALATIFALTPLLILLTIIQTWAMAGILLPLLVLRWYLGDLFRRRIGGFTGDCLGAAQQIAEVLTYLSLIVIWRFF